MFRTVSMRVAIRELTSGVSAEQTDRNDETIPVTRIEAVGDGFIHREKLGSLDPSNVPDRFLCHAGDIIYSNINSIPMIGRCAQVSEEDLPVAVGMNTLRFRPNLNRFDQRFFFWALYSDYMRAQARAWAKPAINQASLPQSSIKALKIPMPPLVDQQNIAALLDHETAEIDAFIADQKRLIKLLEERRAATITHAVTKGLDPNVPMKDSGIEWVGDIPSEWELTRIKYLGTTHIGLTYSPEDIVEGPEQGRLVFRAGNIKNGNIDLSDSVYVNKEVPESLLTQRGDILICARSGSSSLIGKNALIDSKNERQTFGAFMTVLRSRNNEYLYWLLNSSLFKAQVGLFITATINQLTNATLNNFIVPLPPASVRSRIVDHLQAESKKIDAAVSDAREAIALSKERRAALISAAVTGQIDVSQTQSRS